ncbi:hypothetical protein TSMEX_009360 [Taenia solium]|eukprot:TsM_000308100 transcript=TsM_000308100 gene=TsM_000308100
MRSCHYGVSHARLSAINVLYAGDVKSQNPGQTNSIFCIRIGRYAKNQCINAETQSNSRRTITDLPPEMALKICGYLHAPDLANVGLGIPSWQWILTTPRFATALWQHINQWTWLDKHLYQLLFPQPSPTSYKNALEAICYQKNQMDSYELFMSTPLQGKACNSAQLRILPNRHPGMMSAEELMLRLEASRVPFFDHITMVKYRKSIHTFGNRRGHDCCDCVVYLVIPSQFSKNDLIAALDSLAPHQTLIIAVLVNGTSDKSSGMECLVQFLHSLGDFDSSPLAAVPTNWRILCIKYYEESFINWSDLLNWSFLDVISTKIEGGCNRSSILVEK